MTLKDRIVQQLVRERRTKGSLAAIIVVGIVLALGAELRIQSVRLTVVDGPIRSDAKDYVSYALNMARHGVYSRDDAVLRGEGAAPPAPDALRSPGYPLFLAAILGKDPRYSSLQTVLLVQAVLSVATIYFAYLLLRTMASWPWAAVGALLTALSPHLVTMNVYLLTESLFAFLLVAGMFVVIRAYTSASPFGMLLGGVLLGAGALTRPSLEYLLIPLALFIYLSARAMNRSFAKRASVALVLGFAVVYAPWLVRNVVTLDATGDRTLMINTLHHGLYPDFRYNNDPQTFGYPYRYDPRTPEIAASVGSVLQEIRARFAAQPAEHARWYLIGKPVMFWAWTMAEGPGDVFVYPVLKTPYAELPHFYGTHWLMRTLHVPLLLLALVGTVLVWLPQKVHGLSDAGAFAGRGLALVLWYFTLLHMVGAPFPRYSVPLRPLEYGVALLPLWRLAHIASAWRRTT